MNTTNSFTDLPTLFQGKPPGTVYRIESYQDTAGNIKNLEVRTLGPDGYRKLQEESLRILNGSAPPALPGFEPDVATKAHQAMVASLQKSMSGVTTGDWKELYAADPAGGFSRKPGTDDAVYLLRVEVLSEQVRASAPQAPAKYGVPQAKEAIAKLLRLPTDRYEHAIKLVAGKFSRVTIV